MNPTTLKSEAKKIAVAAVRFFHDVGCLIDSDARWLRRRAAEDPCVRSDEQCPTAQPDRSYWCVSCIARSIEDAVPEYGGEEAIAAIIALVERAVEEREPQWNRVVDSWPKPYRMVLVATAKFEETAPAVNVGYMKYSGGEPDRPYFICPGAQRGFVAAYWSDCLGDNFTAPLWQMTQPRNQKEPK